METRTFIIMQPKFSKCRKETTVNCLKSKEEIFHQAHKYA